MMESFVKGVKISVSHMLLKMSVLILWLLEIFFSGTIRPKDFEHAPGPR